MPTLSCKVERKAYVIYIDTSQYNCVGGVHRKINNYFVLCMNLIAGATMNYEKHVRCEVDRQLDLIKLRIKECGVTHKDLRTSNILVDTKGKVC
jgi:tRNA A-37 threonylcarbamoyl transferase component Bud32